MIKGGKNNKIRQKRSKMPHQNTFNLEILNVEKGVLYLHGDYTLYSHILRKFLDKEASNKSLQELVDFITSSDWRASLLKLKALKSSASLMLAERLFEKISRLESIILNDIPDLSQVKALTFDVLMELKETMLRVAKFLQVDENELCIKFVEDAIENFKNDLITYVTFEENKQNPYCQIGSCRMESCKIF